MHFTPITIANAVSVGDAAAQPVFIGLAQKIGRGLKVSAYSTDEYGLSVAYVPSVYRDCGTSLYLAGYCVCYGLGGTPRPDIAPIIDHTAMYADAEAAALAADKFADGAAERARGVVRLPLSEADEQALRQRSHRTTPSNAAAVNIVRALCTALA